MKEIIFNDNNLKESDFTEKVIRVKGLIINSDNKILIAHNNNTYQFPGGHLEENENMDECIKREIKEETGIDVNINEEPFLCIRNYDNNYFGTGRKVLNSIYYYRFFTDDTPNFDETNYDELELETEFNLFYVYFPNLKEFINKSIEENTIEEGIGREMIRVVNEYNEIFKNN